jgi:hypothetical protein
VCGDERVDLPAALELLRREHGARAVRVDSGGRLNGAFLRAGLVDEVSLLVHAVLVGGRTPRSMFVADDLPQGARGLLLDAPVVETLEEGSCGLARRSRGLEALGERYLSAFLARPMVGVAGIAAAQAAGRRAVPRRPPRTSRRGCPRARGLALVKPDPLR